MNKTIVRILIIFMLMTFGGAATAHAFSTYLSNFNTTYGTSATVLNTCGLCHINPAGGGARNSYGTDFAGTTIPNHTAHAFDAALEARDSDGDCYTNIVEITARTFPGDAASHPAFAVSSFTAPPASNSLTVSITALTTNNICVAGYIVTESATAPAAGAAGWSATPPSSYTFASAGSKTLYAWAKDTTGNVSASLSANVTVTLPPAVDSTPPTVTAFAVPPTASSLSVSITTFTATDNIAVTGYLITETAAAPAASAAGWSTTAPSSYTLASAGSKTLYAWAKDAAGNVSAALTASVTITLPSSGDTVPPKVKDFKIASASYSLTVTIKKFIATDNVGVTGYMVTESSSAPSPSDSGWSATAPTAFTFSSLGKKTLYAWAMDAAGNVSKSRKAMTIIKADKTPPVIRAFKIAKTSATPTVSIISLIATDNVAVTGYYVSEDPTKPSADSAGWTAAAPASYTFTSSGTAVSSEGNSSSHRRTLYAWAKDAAGNVSARRSAKTRTEDQSTDTVSKTQKSQGIMMDSPSDNRIFTFDAVDEPARAARPEDARPIGIGPLASGGSSINMKIDLGEYSSPVDVYLGVYSISPGDEASSATRNENPRVLKLWKANVTELTEDISSDVKLSQLKPGPYVIMLEVTPAGRKDRSHVWVTNFVAP